MTTAEQTILIDRDLCTGCGLCARVCPKGILSVVDGKARVTGHATLECGHCEAACPEGAVRVAGLDPEQARFATFHTSEEWLPFGRADTGELVRLMRSRRSCRNYKPDPVPGDMLSDLVKVAVTAPSGTNSQLWTFTVLPDRAAVLHLGRQVAAFFHLLNRRAANPVLRQGLRLAGRAELAHYHREYYPSVRDALEQWERDGTDLLFHGATAAIVVGSRPGASCPAEDALLASQNMLLAAHAMGLGACLIGYAVSAMARDEAVKRAVGIPEEEAVHAVVALGRPDEKYVRVTGRRAPLVRTFRP